LESLVKRLRPDEEDESWRALGDAADVDAPKAPPKKQKTKALLKLAGKNRAEEFPFLTLKKLGSKVSSAKIEDESYLEAQKGICKDNLRQFKKVEKQSQELLERSKTVRENSHSQAQLRRGFWKTSREEERKGSQEIMPLLVERSKQYSAFQQRSSDNIKSAHLLLQASKLICTRIKKITKTAACSHLYEEPVVNAPKDSKAFLSNRALFEKHKLQSTKYEESQAGKWAAQGKKDLSLNPAKDPDTDGFPKLAEEADVTAGLQELYRKAAASSGKASLVVSTLSEMIVALQAGGGAKMDKKKATNLAELVNKIRAKIIQEWQQDIAAWQSASTGYIQQQRIWQRTAGLSR